MNQNGTLDTGFNPDSDDDVLSIALQADGKILIGGDFTTIGGERDSALPGLNQDGTLDTDFDPTANSAVASIALQADGEVLVGGAFTAMGGVTETLHRPGSTIRMPLFRTQRSSNGSTVPGYGGSKPEVWRVTFEHLG